MKIAITGGSGFVGSYLVPALVRSGHNVRLLTRVKMVSYPGASCVVGSISSEFDMVNFLDGADAVINLIGRFDPPFDEQVESNVTALFHIVNAAGKVGIKKLIHLSAAAVYGDLAIKKIPIETDPVDPTTPYGLSKFLGEEVLHYSHAAYGITPIILRPTNIYGVDSRTGVLHSMAQSLKEKGSISITGDGEQVRDFIHVEDLVSAIMSIVDVPPVSSLYNVSSGETLTLNDLAKIFAKVSDEHIDIVLTAEAKGFVRSLRASNSQLMHDYMWKPRYTVEETILEIIKK